MQVGSNTLQTILGLSKNKDVIVYIFRYWDTQNCSLGFIKITMCWLPNMVTGVYKRVGYSDSEVYVF